MEIFFVLLLALVLDRLVGDPDWLWRRLPHPVVGFGKAISVADRLLNRPSASNLTRRLMGVVAIVVLLALSLLLGALIHTGLLMLGGFGVVLEIVIVAVFLAQKSLSDHVMRVADGLSQGGLEGGRKAVSMIVGRDPQTLDEPAVCRAALESLSENFADGVVAPALWYAILGLPGILAYKMLNTADSMIGHKSETYLYFGWASARLDDLANWPASRFSALLIAAGAAIGQGEDLARRALAISWRDHGLHRSPNSGWPEAAMAGALNVQLAGPRIYGGQLVNEPMINREGRSVATVSDIRTGISIYQSACTVLTALVFIGFVVVAYI